MRYTNAKLTSYLKATFQIKQQPKIIRHEMDNTQLIDLWDLQRNRQEN